MKMIAALVLLAAAIGGAMAKEAAPLAEDAVVERRLIAISEEMRCLVCQNESLAGSGADLARDLRRELREQIRLGKSEAEIRFFVTSRYGDFVLYRPPFKAATLLLWLGPFLLAFATIGWVLVQLRRRAAMPGLGTLSEQDNQRVDALLRETGNA